MNPVITVDNLSSSTSSIMKIKRSLSSNSQFSTNRRLSCEEIINTMENEQDAIVVRLLRDVNKLKQENSRLRSQLNVFHQKSSTSITTDHLKRLSVSSFMDDEALIIDDAEAHEHGNNMIPTPRGSFTGKLNNNNSSNSGSSPTPSRRPSTTNSNTIFPIQTNTPFLRAKRSSFSNPSTPTTIPIFDNAIPVTNRKRRTSSVHSLEKNIHFKNHDKIVDEILPSR